MGPVCNCCGVKPATDRHHQFPQTKVNRRLYKSLLDDPRNIQRVCNGCHASHASPRLIHWDENKFCEVMGIDPRSKTAKVRMLCG